MSFATPKNVQNATGVVFGIIMVSLLWLSIRTPPMPDAPPPPKEEACIGTSIVVDYAYENGVNSPYECDVQCEDDKPRYILYSNGKATQCETPPGCLDYGEDHRITCTPPAAMSTTK